MSSPRSRISGAVTILCGAVLGSWMAWAQVPGRTSHPGAKERARITVSQMLPKLDGDHLKATVVEVNYGPGESSPPHRHPCAVLGYVANGAVRTRLSGEPETIYSAGDSFYEAPNGVHAVSANASQTEPAKLIAYFVCDHDTPLSVDLPEITSPGER